MLRLSGLILKMFFFFCNKFVLVECCNLHYTAKFLYDLIINLTKLRLLEDKKENKVYFRSRN